MSISAVLNPAVYGMRAQMERLGAVADNVANTGARDGTASPAAQPVDLAAELIDMIGAGIAFKANASVFETGADLWDVLMTVKRD